MTVTVKTRNKQSGFSLIELLIVIAILSIVMGAVFSQITDIQRSSATEQVKLDLFQESREFMDQISRDLRSAGYPNPHNATTNQFGSDAAGNLLPDQQSQSLAVGLVYVNYNELQFEGDVTGTGQVSVIHYLLDTSDPNNLRLKRSQTWKADATKPTDQSAANFEVEVEHVINGTGTTNPIFTAYKPDGTVVNKSDGTRLDFLADATTLASINSLRISLTVQAKNPDPKTGKKPITTLVSTVKLNNCSQAFSGSKTYFMSCW